MLGFAAAPWTLACYMVDGRGRDGFPATKTMMFNEPKFFRRLLEKIARVTAAYLKMQIAAGASAVQLFDTWAGELAPREYREFALPATQLLIGEMDIALNTEWDAPETPVILYSKATSHLLKDAATSGATVLSVDWRVDLAELRRKIGDEIALQGNVDPCVMLGNEADVVRAVHETFDATGGRGHILNLGHGILPTTPVENAIAFVKAGQNYRSKRERGSFAEDETVARLDTKWLSKAPNLISPRKTSASRKIFSRNTTRRDRGTPAIPPLRCGMIILASRIWRAPTPMRMRRARRCRSTCIFPTARASVLFCACNVVITKDHSVVPPYLATLQQEIERVAKHVSRKREVVQFHWGGGTPTYLTPPQMEQLFNFARERFTFAPDAEIGIEVDPRVTSREHLETLRTSGI